MDNMDINLEDWKKEDISQRDREMDINHPQQHHHNRHLHHQVVRQYRIITNSRLNATGLPINYLEERNNLCQRAKRPKYIGK
jgi:hypothetical protein